MLPKIITTLLVIVGLINFLPIIGLVSSDQLTKLYGVAVTENNLLVLMKHRALLFGVIGGFIMYAAFFPHLHKLAFVAGFISMFGFILIAWQTGGINSLLNRILIIDLIASALLLLTLILSLSNKSVN